MLQCEMKANVPAYPDSCQETSLIETGAFSALRFPDIKLTRLEQDASCLKYLQKPFKRKRFKSILYDSDNYETDSLPLTGSESSSNESSVSEYTISDTESSSDESVESVEKIPRVKLHRINETASVKIQNTNTSTSTSNCSETPCLKNTTKIPDKFLKFPIIKLIRLENDENCHKYLNQNWCSKMSETKVDKKLNPIVIITNPNIHGKHKSSFMIKKPECEEASRSEDSKDSCYTSITDSDGYHCNKNTNSFSFNLSSTDKNHKPSNILSRECSITLEPLALHAIKGFTDKGKSLQRCKPPVRSDPSDSPEKCDSVIDPEDSCSLSKEELPSQCVETDDYDSHSDISASFSEDSNSSEIMRCFENLIQTSEDEESSSSAITEEENSTPNVEIETAEVQRTKAQTEFPSCLGISGDTVMMSDGSFFLAETILIPNNDPESGDEEERFIIEFIDDDVFERLRSQANDPPPIVNATCDLCGEAFTTRPSLYQHIKQSHNCVDFYECAHCGQVFSVKACLVYHLYAKLFSEDRNFSESHVCPKYSCSKSEFTVSELEFLSSFYSNHAYLHSKLEKSEAPDSFKDISPKTDESAWALVPVKEVSEDSSESALISVNKDSKHEKLKRKKKKPIFATRRKKQKVSNKPLSNYFCHICRESYATKQMLFDHFSEKHNHLYYFECEKCDQLFQNSISFASHYVKKECIQKVDKKRFKGSEGVCDVCKKLYKNSTILRKHKMNIHKLYLPSSTNTFCESLLKLPTSNSDLNCFFCYEAFSKENSLDLLFHERAAHEFFSCFLPLCSEKFFSEELLEKHLFSHFTNIEGSFCGFCSNVFFTKVYLEKHIKQHFQSDLKSKTKK